MYLLYGNMTLHLQPQTKERRRKFGFRTAIFCSSLSLIVLVGLFAFLYLSMQTSTTPASCTLQTPRPTESKYTCPEMDIDFGGYDITVIMDVHNWEECGKELSPDLELFSLSSRHQP